MSLWPDTAQRDSAGALTIGGVALPALAREFGTPLYIFDEATLRGRARAVKAAFARAYPRSRVVYAGKALLSRAIVRLLHEEGLGLDVVSGGELYAGLAAGVVPAAITFHGNNKSAVELREAIEAGVGRVAVDNDHELTLLDELSTRTGTRVPIVLRLNPGVDVHTHDKIKTGIIDSKFGFPLWTEDAARAATRASASEGLDLLGYHCHLGSQLFDASAMATAIVAMMEFAKVMLDRHAVIPREISPGGGFGIAYDGASPEASYEEWATLVGSTLLEQADRFGFAPPELVVEPGRSIVGPAGVALYEVGARKEIPAVRTYVAVDGGMADNIRPSLYGARYTAELANRAPGEAVERVTIAGKFCESGDILIDDIALPRLRPGDLLAMPAAGAYSIPMASNYNHAPKPAMVLVNAGEARLIRRRETYPDLVSTEEV